MAKIWVDYCRLHDQEIPEDECSSKGCDSVVGTERIGVNGKGKCRHFTRRLREEELIGDK